MVSIARVFVETDESNMLLSLCFSLKVVSDTGWSSSMTILERERERERVCCLGVGESTTEKAKIN